MKSDRRQDLRQRIQAMPGLSPEDRSALLGLLAEKKRYGLVWEDKPEAAHELLREKIPVFVEDTTRRIRASEEDAPHHVLIEGDNLHALAALQYTHAGKIDVIYIDPPYNTGNKDFRYNDDYVDKEDAYRHSKWLSFMNRRLTLAKRLIAPRGVIFVSIDDNELAQLKMICDEVLLEGALIGNIVWVRKKKPAFLSKEVVRVTENILCYKGSVSAEVELYGESAYSEKAVPLINRSNRDSMIRFPPGVLKVGRGVGDGVICKGSYGNGELAVQLLHDIDVREGLVTGEASLVGRFRWTNDTVQEEIALGSEFVISDSLRINVYRAGQGDRYKSPSSLLSPDKGIGTNEDATAELKEVFSEYASLPFSYPKPTTLVKYLIRAATSFQHNAVVLDFFAGSGTTLHATMALNAEDGGKRQCILVTNNENRICEEVCYERNKRVIRGYTTPKGEAVPGLTANHLHYLKTELVDREPTLRNRRKLVKLAVDLVRLKEDAWERQDALSIKEEVQVFQGKDFTLWVVLEVDAIPEVVERIKTNSGHNKVYVLSPDADPFTADFEEVQDRVDLVAIPEAIYRSLLPIWRTLPENAPGAEVADA